MISQVDNSINGFCQQKVPDFTPLGGSRPDAAVVACATVGLYTGGAGEGVVLPHDVLAAALGALCAPLRVRHVANLRGREAHFKCHAVTVQLHTTDDDVLEALESVSAGMRGGLSLTVLLEESVTELHSFLDDWAAVGQVDLTQTSLRCIGDFFLSNCMHLTTVILPASLTEVGEGFLGECMSVLSVDMQHTALHTISEAFAYNCLSLTSVLLPDTVTEVAGRFLLGCHKIQRVDLSHTALHTIGEAFAIHCSKLTTVTLPDTVTEIGVKFLGECGHVEVTSASTAVQAAAAEHNTQS